METKQFTDEYDTISTNEVFRMKCADFNRVTVRKTDTWSIVTNIEHPRVTAKAKPERGMKTGKIVNVT